MFFLEFPSTNHEFWWKSLQNHQKTTNPKKVDFIVQKCDNFADQKVVFRRLLPICWWWGGCHWKEQGAISSKTTFSSSADDYRPSKFQFYNRPTFFISPLVFQHFWNQHFCSFFNLFLRKNHINNSCLIKFRFFHQAWHLKYWMHIIMNYKVPQIKVKP